MDALLTFNWQASPQALAFSQCIGDAFERSDNRDLY